MIKNTSNPFFVEKLRVLLFKQYWRNEYDNDIFDSNLLDKHIKDLVEYYNKIIISKDTLNISEDTLKRLFGIKKSRISKDVAKFNKDTLDKFMSFFEKNEYSDWNDFVEQNLPEDKEILNDSPRGMYSKDLKEKYPKWYEKVHQYIKETLRSDFTGEKSNTLEEVLKVKSKRLYNLFSSLENEIIPILKKIPITEYSHDSVEHAKFSLDNVFALFGNTIKEKFNSDEVFILMTFVLVHDIGMQSDGERTPKQLFAIHPKRASEYIYSLAQKEMIPNKYSKPIADLCLMHNRGIIQAFDILEKYNTEKMRILAIYSMFRIADMLDVEIQPGEILRISPYRLTQAIAGFDIDRKDRVVYIKKAFEANEEIFDAWLEDFNARLKELNPPLEKLDCVYRVERKSVY